MCRRKKKGKKEKGMMMDDTMTDFMTPICDDKSRRISGR
jgi:hypothetical protein